MGVLKSYRMLLEGSITPYELNEVTKFQKYALYNSTEAKDVSRYIKEARRETDDKKKKALYKKALDTAESLRSKASKIPDNDFGDWAIDLCLKPLYLSDETPAFIILAIPIPDFSPEFSVTDRAISISIC